MSKLKEEFLNKFLAGDCSYEEKKIIYSWFNDPDLEKELKEIMLQQLQDLSIKQINRSDFESSYLNILENLKSEVGGVKKYPVRKITGSVLKVAAAILVLLSVSIITYNLINRNNFQAEPPISVIPPTSSNTELILSDGSSIQVESDKSFIYYDKEGQNVEIDSIKTVSLITENAKETPASYINTIVVPYGKRSSLTLSDGTVIFLNSGSSLSYPPLFTGKSRKVYLSGEAYFIVTKNESLPFIVETSDLSIRVLGTEFNICAYNEDPNVETVLVTGSLKVSDMKPSILKKNSTILTPGQMATYSKETGEITDTDVYPELYVSWKDGYSIFNRIDLESLVIKLSRFYNKPIEILDNDLKSITFSGKLEQKQLIDEVMDIISQASHFTYIDEGERILILE
jgi:transmembrane sensor